MFILKLTAIAGKAGTEKNILKKTTSRRKNYFSSPNFSFSYLLTAGQVLPRPEEAVKEAVEDVQGQLKQKILRSGFSSQNYLVN